MVEGTDMSSRARGLESIRLALGDVPADERGDTVFVPYEGWARAGDPAELFARRVEEYRGDVRRIEEAAIARTVSEICDASGVRRLLVPPAADPDWLPRVGHDVFDDRGLSAMELDAVDGVFTGCCLAIAETGTIVLDGGSDSGRRAITLVPDVHICVVKRDQVVSSVPEAIERLGPVVRHGRAPLTFVSGPSATSDIEFRRVEGVHGPRRLVVLLVG
jgi:L-lactate dehydrogenase complex protein LldG